MEMKALLSLLAAMSAPAALAQTAPLSSVIADPPADSAHPAMLVQIRYETAGVQAPGRLFVAQGAEMKGTVLLLHGFPGTELNLDLARAMQRSGWNVLAIHYRGVWGSPGKFSLGHTIEDARAALAWLRAPANAAKYRIDTRRIVVLGHSMGGFDTLMLGDDPGIAGYVLISAADMGGYARELATPAARAALATELAEDISFTNTTFDEMADEMLANAAAWDWRRRAATLKGRPVLIIDSNDGLKPGNDSAAEAIRQAGGPAPTQIKFETDHSYNDHRIALASAVVGWLQRSF